MGKILFGMISPHPPVLLPEVGGGREKEVQLTFEALKKTSKDLVSHDPDTVLIFTPHGDVSLSTVHIYDSPHFTGNFSQFGAPKVRFDESGEPGLAHEIAKEAKKAGTPAAFSREPHLDHGIMVPLYFAKAAGLKSSILPVAVGIEPLKELYLFGKAVQAAVKKSGKKAAVIASADMSHRLKPGAPNGFSHRGVEFDEKLVSLIKAGDTAGILNFDQALADAAGQDSLWSIAMLLGVLDGLDVSHEFLSYEGTFGVGYMVAKYEVKN